MIISDAMERRRARTGIVETPRNTQRQVATAEILAAHASDDMYFGSNHSSSSSSSSSSDTNTVSEAAW